MAQKNRNRRPLSTRRTLLNLEALEERTLLSGNVTATLVPPSGGPPGVAPGTLLLNGDIGNNNISITEAGGLITVTGNLVFAPGTPPDLTTVNGVHSISFQGSGPNAVTNIQVSMMNGNDTVNVGGTGGLAIPNNLTITAGSGKDTFSTTGVSASQITISATGPGADTITMTNTNAGAATLTTGAGANTITLNNNSSNTMKIGTVVINAGGGGTTSNDSVTVENFASVGNPPVSGIGQLIVNTPSNGNNTISVTNTTLTTTMLSATGTGNNTITLASPKVLQGTTILAGTGNNAITVSGALNTLSLNTGGGSATFDGSSASSAHITVGKGPSTVDVSGDTIGAGGLGVNVGTPGNTALDEVTVNNDAVAGALAVNVFDDGPQYWILPDTNHPNGQILPSSNLSVNNDTVKGAESVSTGNFFRTVTVGGTAGSLSATIGDGSPLTSNSQTVAFNTAVSGAESITVGNAFPSQPPIPLLPTSTFSLSGSAGSLALTVGNNFAGGVSDTAVVAGNQSVSIGSGAGAVTVVRPTAGNDTITVGANSGAVTVSGTDTAPDKTTLTETITVGNGSGPITITGSLAAAGSGSWNQTINIGDGTVGKTITPETVTVTTNVVGNQTIQSATGNNDNVTVGPETVSGALTIALPGTGDTITVNPSTVGSLAINAGSNAAIGVTGLTTSSGDVTVNAGTGATITLTGVTDVGSNGVTVNAGDTSSTISLTNVSATSGGVSVTVGAGTGTASIALNGITADNGSVNVTALDMAAAITVDGTTASTINVNNGNGNTFIDLENDFAGTNGAVLGGGLNVTSGNGSNQLLMIGLDVLDGLFVNLGSGGLTGNVVAAENVVTDFGLVNGGSGGSNTYIDAGGNLGFVLMGFIGY